MAVSVPTMLSVGEGNGTVQVCILLSAMEDTERDFLVMLAASNGTGKADLISYNPSHTAF